MNPTLLALIPALVKGAVQIVTDKKAFKENLKAKTTKAAVALVGASAATGVAVPESEEAAITQAVMAILGAVLFFYRKYEGR